MALVLHQFLYLTLAVLLNSQRNSCSILSWKKKTGKLKIIASVDAAGMKLKEKNEFDLSLFVGEVEIELDLQDVYS